MKNLKIISSQRNGVAGIGFYVATNKVVIVLTDAPQQPNFSTNE